MTRTPDQPDRSDYPEKSFDRFDPTHASDGPEPPPTGDSPMAPTSPGSGEPNPNAPDVNPEQAVLDDVIPDDAVDAGFEGRREEVVALMHDGVPEPGPTFWDEVDRSLATAEAERVGSSVDLGTATGAGADGRIDADIGVGGGTVIDLSQARDSAAARQAPDAPAHHISPTTLRLMVAAALLVAVGGAFLVANRIEPETSTAAVGVDSAADNGSSAEEADGAEEPEPPATSLVPALSNSAEPGLNFDFGEILAVTDQDGVSWITFDRHRFGELAGLELTAEPRYELATDFHGGGTLSADPRTYPVASDASILIIEDEVFDLACGSEELLEVFVASSLDDIAAVDAVVSLTFNEAGQVVGIRDQRGC